MTGRNAGEEIFYSQITAEPLLAKNLCVQKRHQNKEEERYYHRGDTQNTPHADLRGKIDDANLLCATILQSTCQPECRLNR